MNPTASLPRIRRRRRRWPWLVVSLVIAVGVTGGFLLYNRNTQARASRGFSSDEFDLRLGKSEVADIQVSVNEVGTIEPVVKVDVKSTLSGKVTDLLVREGEKVSRGQVLARVEPDVNQAQTLSQVRSGMNLAEIKAKDAKRDLETNQRLREEGYVSETEFRTIRVKFDTAMEDLDAAKTRMRIVEESGIPLDSEISTSQRVNIVSPMEGYVIKKNVEVGQTATSGLSSFNEGTVLYTVADLRSMLIKAAINEVDIGRVRLGMPVVITVDAFPYRKFDGAVSHISPAARLKEKIKVFDIEITLKNQVADFRAGMTANVEIRGDRVEKSLSVPVESIFKKNDRDVVYVLRSSFAEPKEGAKKPRKTKSGKYDISDVWERYFEEREVKVGLASLEKAQILGGIERGTDLALEDPTRPRQIEED
jgi:HlyD family secretion protein